MNRKQSHDGSLATVSTICFRFIMAMLFYVPFGEFVHLHMHYYSFANSLLKHSAFQFFTPARKPPTTFYLESLLSR